MRSYDIVVIGAGVVGSWISYYLSQYKVKVCVLEKENDAASGTSKANSAIIHAGYDPEPGTLMARLNVRGNEIVREKYKEMAIPFRQIGSLVVAFDDEGEESIKKLFEKGQKNGVPDLSLLNKEEVIEMEPHITPECRGALYAQSAGVCSSFEMTVAPLEIANVNGVDFIRNFEVKEVEKKSNKFIINDEIETSFVINAAGLYGDKVASLFGDNSISIHPRRGEYALLDNKVNYLAHHTIFQPPTKSGKGILVTPTYDGNILLGPTASDSFDKEDLSTTDEAQRVVFEKARLSIPEVSERSLITSFTGLRAINNSGDFVIGYSSVDGLFNVSGICSPGLTAAPAIGEYVITLLKERGIIKEKKENYQTGRRVVRFFEKTKEEQDNLIKTNPLYGRVICRCEKVTEGEIVDAIKRPVGAIDMDGVKRRVRAGMGRCQGGFCTPRVMEILSRELGISYTEVTKRGGKSWMVRLKGESNENN